MRISDWSSDVCSSDLAAIKGAGAHKGQHIAPCAGHLYRARNRTRSKRSRHAAARHTDKCEPVRDARDEGNIAKKKIRLGNSMKQYDGSARRIAAQRPQPYGLSRRSGRGAVHSLELHKTTHPA